jgi:hypothetical protein
MDSTAETGTRMEIPEVSLSSINPWSARKSGHAEMFLFGSQHRVSVSPGNRRSATSRSTDRTARREHWIVRTGRYVRLKSGQFRGREARHR